MKNSFRFCAWNFVWRRAKPRNPLADLERHSFGFSAIFDVSLLFMSSCSTSSGSLSSPAMRSRRQFSTLLPRCRPTNPGEPNYAATPQPTAEFDQCWPWTESLPGAFYQTSTRHVLVHHRHQDPHLWDSERDSFHQHWTQRVPTDLWHLQIWRTLPTSPLRWHFDLQNITAVRFGLHHNMDSTHSETTNRVVRTISQLT